MHLKPLIWLVASVLWVSASPALAEEEGPWRVIALASIGSVEDAGYGAKGTFGGGVDLGDVFSLELQGGIGVTEEIDLGTERFYHLDLLLPARMTICSSKSWVCPESTFELVFIGGVGGAYFTGKWAPTVVGGAAMDSFRVFGPLNVGIRVGFVGHYDVTDYEHLVVMLQLNLGVIVKFG